MKTQPQPVGTTKLAISVRSLREDELPAADTSCGWLSGHSSACPSRPLSWVTRITCGRAGEPVRLLHSYAQGGHAFGLRPAPHQAAHRPLARAGGAVAAHHRRARPSGKLSMRKACSKGGSILKRPASCDRFWPESGYRTRTRTETAGTVQSLHPDHESLRSLAVPWNAEAIAGPEGAAFPPSVDRTKALTMPSSQTADSASSDGRTSFNTVQW